MEDPHRTAGAAADRLARRRATPVSRQDGDDRARRERRRLRYRHAAAVAAAARSGRHAADQGSRAGLAARRSEADLRRAPRRLCAKARRHVFDLRAVVGCDALGQLLERRQDPAELAADPLPDVDHRLRRRARAVASARNEPQPGVLADRRIDLPRIPRSTAHAQASSARAAAVAVTPSFAPRSETGDAHPAASPVFHCAARRVRRDAHRAQCAFFWMNSIL
ncbi:hypothetical protein BVI2075_200106 [Burkholderia vietnamiensis]|nr:hypothetical protein BVI2075_200106 [Burkholderia vietnamiensis]